MYEDELLVEGNVLLFLSLGARPPGLGSGCRRLRTQAQGSDGLTPSTARQDQGSCGSPFLLSASNRQQGTPVAAPPAAKLLRGPRAGDVALRIGGKRLGIRGL